MTNANEILLHSVHFLWGEKRVFLLTYFLQRHTGNASSVQFNFAPTCSYSLAGQRRQWHRVDVPASTSRWPFGPAPRGTAVRRGGGAQAAGARAEAEGELPVRELLVQEVDHLTGL